MNQSISNQSINQHDDDDEDDDDDDDEDEDDDDDDDDDEDTAPNGQRRGESGRSIHSGVSIHRGGSIHSGVSVRARFPAAGPRGPGGAMARTHYAQTNKVSTVRASKI